MKWREWLLSLAPEYFNLVRTARKLDVNYWQITVENIHMFCLLLSFN
jgi:hypothetical protein